MIFMRRQESKELHLTDSDRARIESDVEAFLAKGGEIQEIPIGHTTQTGGLAPSQVETARRAGKRGSAKTSRAHKVERMRAEA
jgi:hypothetical protein